MSLTSYKEGSLKELLSIALPLMLSTFSLMLMLFADRLFLAHYSPQALNAAVNASTFGSALVFSWVTLANISEVFVAQYHGAKQFFRLGEPTWQMLWLALLSCLFFIPMAIWGTTWIYGSSPETELERTYLEWMLFFGPFYVIYGALSGFFVGQGKTFIITVLAIGANIVNATLDVCLIFGVEGFIKPMGITGAAISTSIGSLFQAVILFYFFLSEKNRKNFGTDQFYFNSRAFWQCLKVGFPGFAFILIEILGWASFYSMMTLVSEKHITIAGICQSLFLLLLCFAEGVSKATTAIAGNFIGSKRTWFIPDLIRSGLKIHVVFLVLGLLLFFNFHQALADQFLANLSLEYRESIEASLNMCLFITLIYIFFESIRWIFSGILTAAGDTAFLMIAGSSSVWILLVAPTYFFVVKGNASIEVAISFWLFFSMGTCLIYLWRYRSGVWKSKSIISDRLEPVD
jgi:MATE family multidrug resistance protein